MGMLRAFAGVAALAMALATTNVAAAAVGTILDHYQQHGYTSPLAALQRLQAVEVAPGSRRSYYPELARLATMAGREDVASQAQAQLLRLADEEGCDPCRVLWHVGNANLAFIRDLDEEAKLHLEQARGALEEDPTAELQLAIATAETMLHVRANAAEMAIESAIAAASLATSLDRPAEEVDLLGLALQANIIRGDLNRALELSHKVYARAERIGFSYQMALTRTNQAYIHGADEDYPKFHQSLKDALKLTSGAPGMEHFYVTTLVNLSAYHIYVHEYDQAIEVALRAEQAALEHDIPLSRAFAASNRGSAMVRNGDISAGLALMEEAGQFADEAGDQRSRIDLLEEKVNVHELVGQSDAALKELRRVIELERRLTRTQREAVVQELQERYSAQSQAREIARLSAENALRRAEVEARNWEQRMWIATAAVLGLTGLLLVQWLTRARARNRTLQLDNAHLNQQSMHDPLTGAFNRRYFEHLMSELGAKSSSAGLVLVDLDHFKQVNDHHGHAVGDAVLVAVAQRLQTLGREHDAVIRWGGEEFLLVFAGAKARHLPALAQRLLDVVATEPIETGAGPLTVTCSAGALAWPLAPGEPWQDAMQVADLALYRSKATGRNRATCVVEVAADADLERLRTDLEAAEAASDVVLHDIPGRPTQRRAAPVADAAC